MTDIICHSNEGGVYLCLIFAQQICGGKMANKMVSKNRGQMLLPSLEINVDVYIILKANNSEVAGVSYSCRDASVTKERDVVGKKLFDILSTDFTKLHTDWVVKMQKTLLKVREEQVVDDTPATSYPLYQKMGTKK